MGDDKDTAATIIANEYLRGCRKSSRADHGGNGQDVAG